MINTLHIKNIGIIEDITIDFTSGFNILTGETGAGKTLIIDALKILSGDRFLKEMIRYGEKYSLVEMALSNLEDEEENIIISREINTNGKNICKINGRMVTVGELKQFMKNIIDIHGQNDNQKILDNSEHIIFLDAFAGDILKMLKQQYREKYGKYKNLKEELKKNYGDEKEKERKLDLLKYQVNEIENANLKLGEEADLEQERTILASSEKIVQNLSEAECEINEKIIDELGSVIKLLEKIIPYKSNYQEMVSRIRNSYYELQEVASEIIEEKENVQYDENTMKEIENRLELLYLLKRKYGNNEAEILEYNNKMKQEIYEIENSDELIKNLKQQLTKIKDEMNKLAIQMHEIRLETAKKLSQEINKELKELEMKNAIFDAEIQFNFEEQYNENGLDKVEFVISTNTGEEKKPLIKIASGGEMSRIMLAIKTVLADVDKTPILVFDEIDTGISGIAANSTGDKMKKIAQTHQVLCITHLASIAAKGDNNIFISKSSKGEKTYTNARILNEDEIINEIARIASGELTEISIKHAIELRRKNLLKAV